MKSIAKYLGIIAMTLTIVSCGKDDPIDMVPDPVQEEPKQEEPKQEDPQPEDPQPEDSVVPTLTSIDPTSGPKTTLVTILGEHFGTDTSKIKVFFNEQEATIQTVADSIIKAEVPIGAGTGTVKVQVDSLELMGPEFEYELTVLVSTLAGSVQGDRDGTGTEAKFNVPARGVLDAQGNLYITDFGNHKIKKISPSGVVTTFAGSTQGFADGPSTSAKFTNPLGIVMDELGNIFVADNINHRIRRITPSGEVSTIAGSEQGFADGIGGAAQFSFPSGLAIDNENNLYVADAGNNAIRKIDPRGHVTSLTGGIEGSEDGDLTNAKFNNPKGIVFDKEFNLYVADEENHSIRKITPDGNVTTIAGGTKGLQNGSLAEAQFDQPTGLSFDSRGNLYVADFVNDGIRKISPEGVVSTLAGGTESLENSNAQFVRPFGLVVDAQNNVFVMVAHNNKIQKITQE